jgi:hypothetical protein
MITYFLAVIGIGILLILVSPLLLLPNVSGPSFVAAGVATATTYMGGFFRIFPITAATLLILFIAFVGIDLSIFGYKFTMRIKKLFWAS